MNQEDQIMRKLFGVLAIGVFISAGQASAGQLTSASFAFQLGTLPGAAFPGAGATGSATSNLSASLGAGTAFNGAFTTPIPTSAAPPLTHIQVFITKNAGQTFTGASPTQVGGDLAFEGVANVYGIGGFPKGSNPLLGVPLNLGSPGTIFKSAGGVAITAIGASWTAGAVTVTGLTSTTPSNATNMLGTAMATGSNGLTASGAGTLVLVSPSKIITNVAGTIAAFSTLTLTYAPEPGAALLFGAAIACLAVLGRRRM
jgi:hypothetical protein